MKIVWQSNNSMKNTEIKKALPAFNSSDVPSGPHNLQHLMGVLSGIGTIYEVKQGIAGASHDLRKQIYYIATFETRDLETNHFKL